MKLTSKLSLYILRVFTFFKVVRLLYKGLYKNNESNKIYQIINREMEKYEKMFSSIDDPDPDPALTVFPSGGRKLINNYYGYKDAVQFRTKMKYILKFHLDLNALDNDGTLRKFMNSLEKLDKEVEEVIRDRVISIKKMKKSGDGIIRADLAVIKSQKFRDYYLKLIKEE